MIIVTAITVSVIFLTDVLFAGRFSLAFLKLIIIGLAMLATALIKFKSADKKYFLSAGFFIITAFFALFFKYFETSVVDKKAHKILKAIETYRSQKGENPKTLNELAPAYIESIPRAKDVFMWNKFYFNKESLCYAVEEPENTVCYDINNNLKTVSPKNFSKILDID
ncbi:MAG: hypothetical protein ACP5SD_04535 [Elusimicrobiales bacterium]